MKISDLFKGDGKRVPDSRHSVIVYFQYGHESLELLHTLESKLRIALYNANAGELDGHEIAMDSTDGFLYLYGNNAEELFKAIRPILLMEPFMHRAEVSLRFGDIDDDEAKEIDFILE
jgi:hypothetical protein